MTWLDELTPDERRHIDNGALHGERHRVGALIAKYNAVIEHQEKQPGSVTRDLLLTALSAQVELLRDEHNQIQQRIDDYHEWMADTARLLRAKAGREPFDVVSEDT